MSAERRHKEYPPVERIKELLAPADNAHRFVQPSIMENWGPIVVSDTAPSEYCAPDGDCA